MTLIGASRGADLLSREAAVPETGNLDLYPHGREGRLTRPAIKAPKQKKVEGPRAYAPRV